MKRLFNYLTTLSPTTLIDGLAAVLVILIALAALGISFVNLAALAHVNGFGPVEDWAWAWQMDGFIAVATLAVLRARLTGARDRYAWFLVGTTTAGSVLFNAFHQIDHPVLAMVMRGLPPVTLFLSFHLFTGFVQEWVERRGLARTRAELEGQVQTLEHRAAALECEYDDRVQTLDRDVQTRTDKLETLKAERANVQKDVRDAKKELSEVLGQVDAARAELATLSTPTTDVVGQGAGYVWTTIPERRELVLTLIGEGRQPGEIAEQLIPPVVEKTIRRDMLALNGQVQHAA